MQVKTDKWHFKYLYRPSFRECSSFAFQPTNLCSYFWRCVFTIFAVMVVSLLAVMVIGFTVMRPLFALGIVAAIVAIAAVCIGWDEWEHRNRDKEPGMVQSYFKAKKDKVCPVIEIVKA